MHESRYTGRRNVLKTLGATVVGGTVLTGTVAAGSGDSPDKTIVMDNFAFLPRRASVTLDSDGTAVVRWDHQHLINGNSPPHDVHIFESSDHSNRLVYSGNETNNEDNLVDLWYGDVYDVRFTDEGEKLHIEEVRDDSGTDSSDDDAVTADDTAEVSFGGGSVTLHTHCTHHDPGMAGSLTITR